MVCVFLSFMVGDNRVIKEFGLSLAAAVFLDALVIRCMLLPAVLELVGERTWTIPGALERLLPRLNIEGADARAHRVAGEGQSSHELGDERDALTARKATVGAAAEGVEG
jgi:RND superfamily putative drug exporter